MYIDIADMYVHADSFLSSPFYRQRRHLHPSLHSNAQRRATVFLFCSGAG